METVNIQNVNHEDVLNALKKRIDENTESIDETKLKLYCELGMLRAYIEILIKKYPNIINQTLHLNVKQI